MMSTMNAPIPPHIKARANSDGYAAAQNSSKDYPHERASSSEAQLPSYHHHHRDGHDDRDDDSAATDESNSTAPRAHSQPQQAAQHSSSYSTSTATKPPRLQPISRDISDGSTDGRLQTIESGISLADSAPQNSPKPPLHPSNTCNNGSLPASVPNITEKEVVDHPRCSSAGAEAGASGRPQRPEIMRSRLRSDQTANSHYSADAGKHGFLSARGDDLCDDNDSDGGSEDNGSAASSGNGSLVFKYLPGRETPPADYALPASILRVYGVDTNDAYRGEGKDSGSPVPVEYDAAAAARNMQWHRQGSSFATGGSKSSIVYSASSDEEGSVPSGKRAMYGGAAEAKISPAGTPATSVSSRSSSSLGIPTLLGQGGMSETSVDLSPRRILPYHERKRLVELEEEEEKRNKTTKILPKKSGKGKVVRHSKKDELTPLNDRGNGYGTSAKSNNNKEEEEEQTNTENRTATGGWFTSLVQIVTGKSDASIQDEKEQSEEEQRQDRRQSIDEFRDRGQAFLRKTEKERLKLKEQGRMDELNNVTIPVTKQSFSHSRAKMSSLSQALDSIVSVSDDEESSDEESGSSYYWRQQEQPNKVWKYGDLPTTTNNNNNANKIPTNKKKAPAKLSKHDRMMTRERLMQEEYEYRLHSLKRENEKLSKKFRVFVLVTVALIFAGALAFAFAICVKMLMSF